MGGKHSKDVARNFTAPTIRNSMSRFFNDSSWNSNVQKNDSIKEIKVILIGNVAQDYVYNWLVHNTRTTEYDPIIEETARKKISHLDREYILDIILTASEEEYQTMIIQSLFHAQRIVICCLIDSLILREDIERSLTYIESAKKRSFSDFPILLVAVTNHMCSKAPPTAEQLKEFQELAAEKKLPSIIFDDRWGNDVSKVCDGIMELGTDSREVRKAARLLAQGYRSPSSFFTDIGKDTSTLIASFCQTENCLSQETALEIAKQFFSRPGK